MKIFFKRLFQVGILVLLVFFGLASLNFLPEVFTEHIVSKQDIVPDDSIVKAEVKETVFVPSYVKTPKPVKGIYITSWTASVPALRNALVKLIDETEINSIVIDIKDYSGKIVFPVSSPELKAYGSEEIRTPDLQNFIEELHKKGIYVIGRVAVFQDAYFVKFRPDLAVKNKEGIETWKDRKGISWIDPGSREYWDYMVLLANESRKIGFDEINFDYIRFPSDGDMQDISYPWSSSTPKALVLEEFFEYLHGSLFPFGNDSEERLKISADLFGMTTTAKDDMGIGQLLENALPYFDYVCPMVYPSHYPATFQGFADPEKYPYEVIKFAMKSAVDRAELMSSTTGRTVAELRPWLQDFGLRSVYGKEEIRAQIRATNDVGLDSWLLWSASNKYTRGALDQQ